jgi:hypothetical protein
MNSTLAIHKPINEQLAQAEFFVKSGFMPRHFDTVPKVYAAITLGQELGLAPWAALNNIFVIGGKPSINANLMLSLIQSSGLLSAFEVDANDARAIVTMGRKGVGTYVSTFSLDDAKRAQLTTGSNAHMWTKYPKAMLKARAIADCARTLFADVLLGMYTPEELGAQVEVDKTGEIIVLHETVPALPETVPVRLSKSDARALAKKWADSDALTSADIRAALGGGWEDWAGDFESADARVKAWIDEQHAAADQQAATTDGDRIDQEYLDAQAREQEQA